MHLSVIYDRKNGHGFAAKIPEKSPFVVYVGKDIDEGLFILKHIGRVIALEQDQIDRLRAGVLYTCEYWNEMENVFIGLSPSHAERFRHFAAYGNYRLRVNDNGGIQEHNPMMNLLDIEEAQIFNVFRVEMLDLSVNNPTQFEKIKQAILKFMPEVSDIVKEDESNVISNFLFVENGKKVSFEQLVATSKSLVLMVGDMIFRLLATQPEIDTVADLKGIVLIDELELHLSAQWQQDLPCLLHDTFPEVQFIVTTNSALCVASMPENSILFRVERRENGSSMLYEVELDTKNLLPNQILMSSLFDVDIFNRK